jgi:hypothetical protein
MPLSQKYREVHANFDCYSSEGTRVFYTTSQKGFN